MGVAARHERQPLLYTATCVDAAGLLIRSTIRARWLLPITTQLHSSRQSMVAEPAVSRGSLTFRRRQKSHAVPGFRRRVEVSAEASDAI